ncbi:MAG: ABC transporter permease [Anaerolineales bacterium]|nr:ABC transporter permease [Anaerolineales bacterium]
MRIVHLALKDLSQILRQKKSALFLLLMPLLFTWLMGVLFGQNSDAETRLPVGLVDRDGGILGGHLATLLDDSESIRPVSLEDPGDGDLEEQVRSQDFAAIIIVPAGFSQQTLTGGSPQLILLVDANTPAGQIAERAIALSVTRLLGAVQAGRISLALAGDPLAEVHLSAAVEQAVHTWGSPRVTAAVQASGPQPASQLSGGFTQSSAGMMVFFVTIGMITPGYILLSERRSRTLSRLLTTPLTRTQIIAGHSLAMFVLGLAQLLLLALFGQLVLGVVYWQDPTALLFMLIALSSWSSSFGLLISALSHDENQVVLFTLGATLVFGLLGGAFFSLDIVDRTFARIGRLTPTAWAIEGLQNITLGGGFEAVLLPGGVLLAFSLLAFGLAVWRFR